MTVSSTSASETFLFFLNGRRVEIPMENSNGSGLESLSLKEKATTTTHSKNGNHHMVVGGLVASSSNTGITPKMSLIEMLRFLGATGTKLGCSEGGCGSCTVIIQSYIPEDSGVSPSPSSSLPPSHRTESVSVNACLMPAMAVHMKHVITIEGLKKRGPSQHDHGSVVEDKLHPAQRVIANSNGSQCGFCTPGIVMSLYSELQTKKGKGGSSAQEIEDAFDGNLCRCTGYRSILAGARTLSNDVGTCGKECETCEEKDDCNEHQDMEDLVRNDGIQGYANGGTYIFEEACPFPQDLLDLHVANHQNLLNGDFFFQTHREIPVLFQTTQINPNFQWIQPSSYKSLLSLLALYPNAKLINGNTEVGIEVRFKNQNYPVTLYTGDLLELKYCKILEWSGVEWGGLTTISSLKESLESRLESLDKSLTKGFQAILDNVKVFAGRQIRNVSAMAGNITTASPISDLNPVLVALGAILTFESMKDGILTSRKVSIRDFYIGYRKTLMQPGEVLKTIFVPFTKEFEFTSAFKQAKRREDDIAIVNAGFWMALSPPTAGNEDIIVLDSCLSYGGMGPFAMQCPKTSAYMKGKSWSNELVQECLPLLLEDMPLGATSPGGMIEFRKTLAQSFLLKFSLRVNKELSKTMASFTLSKEIESALHEIHRPLSKGIQVYQESAGPSAVGKSVVHLSAEKQVAGEALYTDDIPRMANEAYGIVVGSTIPHGLIENVDASLALKMPGVIDYISAKDLPPTHAGHVDANLIGPVRTDEELFATKEVVCIGQMIGLIVADTEAQARAAAKLVKVTYQALPAVFTIEEAIAANSFLDIERRIETGDFKQGADAPSIPLSAAVHHVEGVARMSAQEHFYLETNASLCVPGEDGSMEVFASTQQAKETQDFVAHVCGVPYHKVVVRVKRMGGGFGGKESRSVFLSCGLALAASKLQRPVRGVLSREEDMVVSGTRHPFRGEYRVGFTNEGRLVSLELNMFANAGHSLDLSAAVLERSLTHCDNSYNIPNMKLFGRLCKTHTATNTAFRGFGGPQGLMVAEQYITHVADYLGKPVEEIRRLNLYKNGEKTHFDMPLESVFLDRAWDELMESSKFQKRRKEVDEYNKASKYRKRGITLMPTKFGLAFTARFLNQAGALVHIYTDGSVRIAHGGTEMGQGLHTKMVQVVAGEFQIPIDLVYLSETRTDLVPNASATAASVSSDINGMALKNACEIILERMEPIRKANPDLSWPELVKKCYFERVNLSSNGFYKTPDLTYDWATNKGNMFSYFTYGAVCTEVEIDLLTGDHQVLSSHMIMDIGTPINPTIDIGQIEGAFVQGMGWCTIEEPLVSPSTGFLFTRGPGLYKIPGFKDIPQDFRVSVMSGVRNTRAIHSSKAVGEPPFFLGASCFFAIRDAITAARKDQGLDQAETHFRLDCPATSERIRLHCRDALVERSETPLKANEKTWALPL